MQIDRNRWYRHITCALTAALLLTLSLVSHAQQANSGSKSTPDDYYRAELVILERIISPGAVNEHMANHKVQPTPKTPDILWSVSKDGTPATTLNLAPANELYLNSAAQRLERSGNYRVLVRAGWYQAFPPDYKGNPLRVEIGDWLNGADTREIEGTITIDRQRYLHVNVHLNHWQLATSPPAPDRSEVAPDQPGSDSEAGGIGSLATGMDTGEMAQQQHTAPLELLTWIRETRRMRSEEVHFLDSPTIGVLVFFKKVEAGK
ncbi:MAG TPA: CsiV family protein [Marinobacter sp.]|nr:CsiV family protein [Marinobacter sp.]